MEDVSGSSSTSSAGSDTVSEPAPKKKRITNFPRSPTTSGTSTPSEATKASGIIFFSLKFLITLLQSGSAMNRTDWSYGGRISWDSRNQWHASFYLFIMLLKINIFTRPPSKLCMSSWYYKDLHVESSSPSGLSSGATILGVWAVFITQTHLGKMLHNATSGGLELTKCNPSPHPIPHDSILPGLI